MFWRKKQPATQHHHHKPPGEVSVAQNIIDRTLEGKMGWNHFSHNMLVGEYKGRRAYYFPGHAVDRRLELVVSGGANIPVPIQDRDLQVKVHEAIMSQAKGIQERRARAAFDHFSS